MTVPHTGTFDADRPAKFNHRSFSHDRRIRKHLEVAPARYSTRTCGTCAENGVRLQLKLDTLQKREVGLADGSCVSVPYVGPVVVRFKNRIGVVGALVLGNEVLLGTPASPNIASGIVKRAA